MTERSPAEQLAEARRLLPNLPAAGRATGFRILAFLLLASLLFFGALQVLKRSLRAVPVPQTPAQTR